jgi:hypothetical protein
MTMTTFSKKMANRGDYSLELVCCVYNNNNNNNNNTALAACHFYDSEGGDTMFLIDIEFDSNNLYQPYMPVVFKDVYSINSRGIDWDEAMQDVIRGAIRDTIRDSIHSSDAEPSKGQHTNFTTAVKCVVNKPLNSSIQDTWEWFKKAVTA